MDDKIPVIENYTILFLQWYNSDSIINIYAIYQPGTDSIQTICHEVEGDEVLPCVRC